jgi:FeS assembly SUF system protein
MRRLCRIAGAFLSVGGFRVPLFLVFAIRKEENSEWISAFFRSIQKRADSLPMPERNRPFSADKGKNCNFTAFYFASSAICVIFVTKIKMTQEEKTKIEERIVDVLKTVYDPEIPVDIWSLGMIYKIDVKDDNSVDVDMTFTAPSCPAADFILEDVRTKIESVEGVKSANVNLVFEPAWDQSMMSEEARVELGFD